MDKRKRPAPTSKLGNSKTKPKHDSSAHTQRARILALFKIYGSLSTTFLYSQGFLYSPARIYELRKMGHKIITQWIRTSDSYGVVHRVGLYVYRGKEEVTDA